MSTDFCKWFAQHLAGRMIQDGAQAFTKLADQALVVYDYDSLVFVVKQHIQQM